MDRREIDFHANGLSLTSGIYEFTLRFQNVAPVRAFDEGVDLDAIAQEIGYCMVRISPALAKATLALLMKHVKDYESSNDLKLPLPEGVQNIWNEYVERS